MSKKTLWIVVSVLALALIGTISLIGVSQWQANRAEAEAGAHKQQRAEQDAKIASQAKLDAEQEAVNRDSAFVSSMQASVAGLDESNPEGTVELGRGICEAISEGDNASTVAYWLTKSEASTPYTDAESADAVSLSVSTYCPEHGPITSDEIQQTLRANYQAEQESKEKLEAKTETRRNLDFDEYFESLSDTAIGFKENGKKWAKDQAIEICRHLDDGGGIGWAMENYSGNGYPASEGSTVVAVTIGQICPEHTSMMDEWAADELNVWN